MKVTGVDIHVVSVPFTHPETWRFGRMWGLTNAIVEVHTDEGITGIGEVPGSPLISLVRDALDRIVQLVHLGPGAGTAELQRRREGQQPVAALAQKSRGGAEARLESGYVPLGRPNVVDSDVQASKLVTCARVGGAPLERGDLTPALCVRGDSPEARAQYFHDAASSRNRGRSS